MSASGTLVLQELGQACGGSRDQRPPISVTTGLLYHSRRDHDPASFQMTLHSSSSKLVWGGKVSAF